MNMMSVIIRQESPRDYVAITEINDLAFKQATEGRLINKLRETTNFIAELSLIAEFEQRVIGHILFYPVKIVNGINEYVTLALAPMAVHPEYQRKGIGSKLVKEGLKRAKDLGYRSIIVVGHPEYYPRFGFKKASGFGLKAPFEVPDNAFLAIELIKDTLKDVKGVVGYPQPYLDTA